MHEYTEKDRQQLKELHSQLERGGRPRQIENVLPRDFAGLEFALFVARNKEGRIIGFSNACLEKEAGYGLSHWTCVHPDYREPPLGKNLMKAKLEWLVGKGVKNVTAQGLTEHGRALLKYLGFEPHPVRGWKVAQLNFEKFRKRVGE